MVWNNMVKKNKERVVKKNKNWAIVFAFFFGHFAWLYTYKFDAWKFWSTTFMGILVFYLGGIILASLFLIGIWIWSVMDMIFKDEDMYLHYGLYKN